MNKLDELMDKLGDIESKLDDIQDKIESCFDLCGQSVDTLVTMDAQYGQLLHDLTKGPEATVLVFSATKNTPL